VSENYLNEHGWAVIDALDEIGRAHGKTPGQTALAWLLTNPVVTAPIIGANHADQLRESLGAVGYRLDAGEMSRLNELTKYPKNWRPIWD
jgi:aryl-alcohol dehydrogenase-like predicted oxidoreductase